MKLIFSIISLLAYLCLHATTVSAQVVHKLNSINSQAKQVTAKTISGADQQRQYFALHDDQIDFTAIESGDVIQVEITPGKAASFRVNRVANYTPTTTSFITASTDNPENTFTFTYSDGMMHGLYHESHSSTYFFEFDKEASQNYVSKSSSFYDDREFCSVHEVDHSLSTFNGIELGIDDAVSKAKSGQTHVPSTAAMVSSLANETIIDVMLVYTANAKSWAESSTFSTIDNLISSAMSLSQSALDNSNTNITLRLVHYYQTNYSFDSLDNLSSSDPNYVSAGDHLRRLTRDDENPFNLCSSSSVDCQESDYDGFFPNAHTLRDQYGADVVAAILSEPNTGGIAWVNNSTAGSPRLAFSINRAQQIGTNYTLIHEIGHNVGNVHARNQPTAEADDFGGLFVYSTGNRFSSGDFNFATVMAYNDGGYNEIPYFSNPNVQFSGTATGNPLTSNSDAGPSDNARSMREIKNVIASYRPTVVDPPVAGVGITSISANLNQQNQTVSVPVIIENTGTSELMWDLDFDIDSDVIVTKRKAANSRTVEAADITFDNGSGGNVAFSQQDEPGVIFETSFEAGEGFTVGDFPARVGWRSFSTSTPFEISSENPSDGNRHLRLPRRADASGSMFSRSPFFGPQPMGEFRVSFDIATQDQIIENSGETFDVYVYDGSNGALSSGIIITGGNIFARTLNEQGEATFSFTGASFPTDGTYRSMEIRYNPNNGTVDYYLEGTLITSNPYPGGRTPDYMFFGQRNEVSGAYMDVDNIRVERLYSPFNWLTTETFSGIIAPGESETVNLTLSAVDVETGDYNTVLLLRSNDPNNPVIEVPITASIEMATSSEILSDVPQKPTLSQNYPNPFNPTTNIEFTLNQASNVTLEVFNITGQKVATLVQDRMPAGSHQQRFDASGLASGIYMYRLQTGQYTMTRQMILIK